MSDVFDEYARIMANKGLLETVKTAQTKEPSRPRGVDPEAIELLYHVKPNGEQPHIMEQAHPEPAVVAPAYDRFNGLVENHLERQDMMQYIALKPNDGKLTQRRYIKANQELLETVIKNAFILDRRKENDLMTLADSCAERLSQEGDPDFLTKRAFWPAVWGAVKLIAPWALRSIGIMGLVNNFGGMVATNVNNDATRAIKKLRDAVQKVPAAKEDTWAMIDNIQHLRKLNDSLARMNIQVSEEGLAQTEEGRTLLAEYIERIKSFQEDVPEYLKKLKRAPELPSESEQWLSQNFEDAGPLVQEFVTPALMGSLKGGIKDILNTFNRSLNRSLERFGAVRDKMRSSYHQNDGDTLKNIVEGLPKLNLDQFGAMMPQAVS